MKENERGRSTKRGEKERIKTINFEGERFRRNFNHPVRSRSLAR